MKQNWLFIALLCLFMSVLVSCNKKQEKNEIIIAVIPKVDNAIFDQVKESAFQAAKELGITLTWEAPTSIDGNKQKELIENLIHYKVDGILISCNDAEMLKEPIDKAIKAGIMVATFDSDAPKSDRIFYIGTDNKKAGKICAETMLKLYEKTNKIPDQILILSGGMSANNMLERISGFNSVMNEKSTLNVLNAFEIPDYGKELLTINLANNKKINGVQLIWGVPVLNGVDSVPALADFLKKGGVSVFFDVSKPLLNYIKNHPNCATMKQDFQAMGYEGVKNLFDAIENKTFKKEILFDVKVIDQSNAEDEITKL
ncbi:MAG TPA: substrate-binding domain-containing protein [Paludibacter sp.]|nr:substrate-binding domain-containing protein [Paludibacter sp.]